MYYGRTHCCSCLFKILVIQYLNTATKIALILFFFLHLVPFSLITSCAFVSNLDESSKSPSLQPNHKDLRLVLEKDLVMNVFRDGQWGVFRHQLIANGT